jgi:hypothetical protein
MRDYAPGNSAYVASVPIGEGRDMSQFMLVARGVDTRGLPAVVLKPIDVNDDFLRKVAEDYFGEWRECRLITDHAGSGESLVDDVCDAQLGGTPIEETTLVRFLAVVVESGVQFVIWHGGDCSDLPTAHSWTEVLGLLRSQTRIQPADVYLRFVPLEANTAGPQ